MYEKNFYNPGYIGISSNSVEGAISVKSYLYDFTPDVTQESKSKVLDGLNKPTLVNLAFHGASKKRNMAIGGRLEVDKQPIINYTYLTFYASKRKKIGFNKLLSLGLEIGVKNININFNNLKLISNNDQAFQTDNSAPFNFFQPNIGLGIYFKAPKYYFGISEKNLAAFHFKWNENFTNKISALNYPQTFICAGYKIGLGNSFFLQPNILYKLNTNNIFYQNKLKSNQRDNGLTKFLYNDLSILDLNLTLGYKDIVALGGTFRTNNTIASIVRFNIVEKIYISYAYDFPFGNSLKNNFKGNHELLLNYIVDFGTYTDKTIDPRYY